MSRIGPEYVGKLPPGGQEQLEREIKHLQNSNKLGVLKGVEILPGPGCAIAEAQRDRLYTLENLPALPLPGCDRSPCCACCYSGVSKDF